MVANAYTCECCEGRKQPRVPLNATHVARMLPEHRAEHADHLDDFGAQVECCLFMCAECFNDCDWGAYEAIEMFGEPEPLINGQVPNGEVPRPKPLNQ